MCKCLFNKELIVPVRIKTGKPKFVAQQYCPKCNEPLFVKCPYCDGTGKSKDIGLKAYCPECKESIWGEGSCYFCDGTGMEYNEHSWCKRNEDIF